MKQQPDPEKSRISDREILITRTFDAPRELVFRAWTESSLLARWWGPRGFTNPVCEWDARPGGKIYIVMRAPHGAEFPMGGEVREIVNRGNEICSMLVVMPYPPGAAQ